jgi:hypothetical protein
VRLEHAFGAALEFGCVELAPRITFSERSELLI